MSKRKVSITESELNKHFSELLFEDASCACEEKGTLNEELSSSDKSDVKTLIRNEIREFLKMSRNDSFETMVKTMVKEYVKKDKDLEKHIVEINKNVLIQLYKTFYTRRNFWTSDLKNSPN